MTRPILALLFPFFVLASCAPRTGGQPDVENEIEAWVAPIEVRTYKGSFTRDPDNRDIRLEGLAGEYLSAQVVVRSSRGISGLRGRLYGLGDTPVPAEIGRVRFGGYVPVDETMVMTADPLLETDSVDVPANTAQPVWITLAVPRGMEPQEKQGRLELHSSEGPVAEFDLTVEILPARLPEPPDWEFYLNIWQDPSGVARAFGVEHWSVEHWRLLRLYAENFAEHGMNSIMTSIVHDPWNSQSGYEFESMVEWNYPGEYSTGGAGKFTWDFTVFDRYVQMMMDAGVRDKIDLYALVKGPGGTLDASIRYRDTVAGQYRTIETEVGREPWRDCWKAFLPVLKEHLEEKGWFDEAMLGFDEKPERVMKMIYDFIIEEAPEFKTVSSGGFAGDERKRGDEIVFHIDDLVNQRRWERVRPIVEAMHADKDRYVSWYTACWPHFPNTFIFSGLRETRIIGWLTWKFGFDGYTRWAVNAYPEDVWNQPLYRWPSGDMFFVWPGDNGPLDSMRWELMRQSIQDYEALRMAHEMATEAGRDDLLEKVDKAVRMGSQIQGCFGVRPVAEARALVNEVIRELGRG